MNIALVIETLAGGGAEHVVHRLALGLAGRGERVFVYCLRDAGAAGTGLRGQGVTLREARSAGRDPLLCTRIADWLRRDRITVAHAHSCAALVHILPAALFLRIPLVHVWHGWPLGAPTRHHRLAVELDRWITRIGVNSQSVRERLPARLARRAVHLPNGIDLPLTGPTEARRGLEALCKRKFDGPVLLTVANVRIEKDICTLVSAFARLRRLQPQAHLICIGATSDASWPIVQRTIAVLGLARQVHFPGPVRDAWQLMAGADVFCLSSRTESMPNVILEAMSQRVPIVATAVGDVGTLVTGDLADHWLLRQNQTALLVQSAAPAALAAALESSLRDRAAARQRAARAYEDYRVRFTACQMVERYMRLYENAAGAANKPNQSARCDARPCCRTILMLGPAATQIGGMVTSIDILMRSPLRERFALYRQATPAPRANSQRVIRRILRHAAALAGLARTLTARRVDLLHIHTCSYLTFYRSVLDLALAKALGCAVVVHIRGGQFENFARSAGRIGQTIIRRALALADALLVVSAHGREIVRPYAGLTPVYAVPNAVEPAAAVSTPHNGHPCRFLYLAKLTRAKGLGDLLRAASELHASDQPFELWIAGPSDDVDQTSWQRAARAAGLEELTTFTGPVRGDAKTQLLRGADCFVHPSHSEALPNAVLEAAAAGLPVIATAVGSLPEALTTAGDSQPLCPLVPPHDVSALVQAMRRLAADSAARQRIGSALRQHVAACNSPARVAEQLAAVYERVLGRARP